MIDEQLAQPNKATAPFAKKKQRRRINADAGTFGCAVRPTDRKSAARKYSATWCRRGRRLGGHLLADDALDFASNNFDGTFAIEFAEPDAAGDFDEIAFGDLGEFSELHDPEEVRGAIAFGAAVRCDGRDEVAFAALCGLDFGTDDVAVDGDSVHVFDSSAAVPLRDLCSTTTRNKERNDKDAKRYILPCHFGRARNVSGAITSCGIGADDETNAEHHRKWLMPKEKRTGKGR